MSELLQDPSLLPVLIDPTLFVRDRQRQSLSQLPAEDGIPGEAVFDAVPEEVVEVEDKLDLACTIKGMYRVLDLITEQGHGGLSVFS